ncbi:MAG: methane monooxygenase/ammonia monooxygenase subunit C [Candidatus Methylacidiphilaceae bacterium]
MAQAQGAATAVAIPARSAFSWKRAGIAIGALAVFYLLDQIYIKLFAVSKGLDYTSADFESYWMSMLYAELALEAITCGLLWGWIWMTRDRMLDRLAPDVELKRYWHLTTMVVVYGFSVYVGASYFTEQDGTYHQTVIRDTDFTPSHIMEFYQSYPIYIAWGVAALIYAMTRLPQFAKAFSMPFTIAVASPLMIFPNVGLNEFGHTRWFMEELFVAPLHWGFVTFGWGVLCALGIWLQVCPRVMALINHVYYGKPIQSPAEVMKDPQSSCDPTACAACAV